MTFGNSIRDFISFILIVSELIFPSTQYAGLIPVISNSAQNDTFIILFFASITDYFVGISFTATITHLPFSNLASKYIGESTVDELSFMGPGSSKYA